MLINPIEVKKITLSSADILALGTTPKLLVAAPGANKILVPLSFATSATNTSTAYTGGQPIILFHDSHLGNVKYIPADADGLASVAQITAPSGNSWLISTLSSTNGFLKGTNVESANIINKALYAALLPIAAAYLTGGNSPSAAGGAPWEISDGSFRISVNGTQYDITGITFPATPSTADICGAINTAMQAITGDDTTVTYDTDHYVFTAPTSLGFRNSISVLSSAGVGTDISGAGATAYLDCETGRGVVTPAAVTPFADGTGTLDIELAYQVLDV